MYKSKIHYFGMDLFYNLYIEESIAVRKRHVGKCKLVAYVVDCSVDKKRVEHKRMNTANQHIHMMVHIDWFYICILFY